MAAAIWLSKVVLRFQEPPREAHVEATVSTSVRLAEWSGAHGVLAAGDDVDMIEGDVEGDG